MTPLVTLYIKIGKMTLEKRDSLHGILQWISKFIMVWHGIPGVKYRPRSNSDESLDGPSVLICNHQSHLDLMTLLPLKKKKTRHLFLVVFYHDDDSDHRNLL